METVRTAPFADTPLEAGCILVAMEEDGLLANLWQIVRLYDDGRCDARCPFKPAMTDTFSVTLSDTEWVGPDLQSVLTYLKLMGIEAR